MGCTQNPCIQFTVNGCLTVPPQKPKIEKILRITLKPFITKTTVIKKKIVFSGFVKICVEYVACVPDCSQPVHFFHQKVPFSHFIEHPRAKPPCKAILSVETEYKEFKPVGPRTISKMLLLKVCVEQLKPPSCYDDKPYCPPSKKEKPGHCKPQTPWPCPNYDTYDCPYKEARSKTDSFQNNTEEFEVLEEEFEVLEGDFEDLEN